LRTCKGCERSEADFPQSSTPKVPAKQNPVTPISVKNSQSTICPTYRIYSLRTCKGCERCEADFPS
jgi:hypothetical protein